MNKRVVSCAVRWGLALAAGSIVAMPGMAADPPLNPACPYRAVPVKTRACLLNTCALWVQVVTGDDGKCEVVVEADELKMGRNNRKGIIFWWLPALSGYEFRKEATPFNAPINFKGPNAPDAPNQFEPSKVNLDGRSVTIVNENTNKKPYDYKVKVFKKGGGANDWLESKDPVIFNDGD